MDSRSLTSLLATLVTPMKLAEQYGSAPADWEIVKTSDESFLVRHSISGSSNGPSYFTIDVKRVRDR